MPDLPAGPTEDLPRRRRGWPVDPAATAESAESSWADLVRRETAWMAEAAGVVADPQVSPFAERPVRRHADDEAAGQTGNTGNPGHGAEPLTPFAPFTPAGVPADRDEQAAPQAHPVPAEPSAGGQGSTVETRILSRRAARRAALPEQIDERPGGTSEPATAAGSTTTIVLPPIAPGGESGGRTPHRMRRRRPGTLPEVFLVDVEPTTTSLRVQERAPATGPLPTVQRRATSPVVSSPLPSPSIASPSIASPVPPHADGPGGFPLTLASAEDSADRAAVPPAGGDADDVPAAHDETVNHGSGEHSSTGQGSTGQGGAEYTGTEPVGYGLVGTESVDRHPHGTPPGDDERSGPNEGARGSGRADHSASVPGAMPVPGTTPVPAVMPAVERADHPAGRRSRRGSRSGAAEPVPGGSGPADPEQPRRRGAGRNLPLAILIGAVLGGLVLASLLIRKEAFVGLVSAAAVIAVWELAGALSVKEITVPVIPLAVGSLGMLVSAFVAGEDGLLVSFALTAFGVLLWRVIDGADGAARDVAASVFTAAYIPFLAGFTILMVAAPDGPHRVIVYFLVTVASDIGGYTSGVLFGRHPMAPTVSPKKSWEGFAGSAITCIVVGVLGVVLLLHGPWWAGTAVGAAAVITATLGDLAESLIKRDLGIKDMGNLLPGHGGMMDRIDSLLLTAPVVYVLLSLLVPMG
ncbi:MAG TPA: phosphatidate cytidylyltransferase [Kineosporiaceae bacterium]|nr:phosphatidate cytidylyltransferase [Kineosporiaceae bacterium]